MDVEGLLLDKKTRFVNLPKDIKTILISQILSKPDLVTSINDICEKNSFICENVDLYQTLWRKYISNKLPTNLNFDEFKMEYQRISNLYKYAHTENYKFEIKDYLLKINAINDKNTDETNDFILKKELDEINEYDIENLNIYKKYEIIYRNTKNIMKLMDNIKQDNALNLEILDKITYIDQMIDNKTLLMMISSHYDEKYTGKLFTGHEINSNVEDINILIKKGADIDFKNNFGYTALMYAIQNSYNASKLLIDAGANTDIQNNEGNTPLMITIKNTLYVPLKVNLIELLLNKNINNDQNIIMNINAQNNNGMTALMLAAERNFDALKILLNTNFIPEININMTNNKGETALMLASQMIKRVELLLNKNANLNIKNNKGQTALWYASDDVISLYLKNGLNKNDVDNKGRSLIFAYLDYYNMLYKLIRLKFDINVKDNEGNNPLMLCKNERCQNLLLKKETGLTTKSFGRATPLFFENDADFSNKNTQINTEINTKTKNNNQNNNQININAVNNKGQNALITLILNDDDKFKSRPRSKAEYYNLITNLIKKGININHKDIYGKTALMYAIEKEKYNIFEYLLKAGANLYITNSKGKNVMEINKNKKIKYNIGGIKIKSVDELINFFGNPNQFTLDMFHKK